MARARDGRVDLRDGISKMGLEWRERQQGRHSVILKNVGINMERGGGVSDGRVDPGDGISKMGLEWRETSASRL